MDDLAKPLLKYALSRIAQRYNINADSFSLYSLQDEIISLYLGDDLVVAFSTFNPDFKPNEQNDAPDIKEIHLQKLAEWLFQVATGEAALFEDASNATREPLDQRHSLDFDPDDYFPQPAKASHAEGEATDWGDLLEREPPD